MLEAPLDTWRGQWDYRPTSEQETEAGQWASEKKPYGYNDLRKPLVNKSNGEYHYDTRNTGSDWSSDDERRAGQAPEAYLAARNRVGIRGGPLRTQSVMRLAPAEGKTQKELDDEGQIPSRGERARPFTNEELRGWEILNDPC
jgi:hypothetical protein